MKRTGEDFELVDRALAGDENAFRAIAEKYQGMVFHISFDILRDFHLAQDCAQETFTNAFTKLAGFRKKSKFSVWLYRIAYNNTINRAREQSARKALLLKDNGEKMLADFAGRFPRPEELLDTKSREEFVNDIISKLPVMYRLPVTLFYKEELSLKEVSSILSLPVGTVKVRLLRARAILKEKLRRFIE